MTSLQLAGATSIILLCIGCPPPTGWRIPRGAGSFLLKRSLHSQLSCRQPCWVSMFLSPWGREARWASGMKHLQGSLFPFTFEGLVLASALFSFPFAVQPMAAAFGAVDRRLLEASWLLGVSRFGTFRRVIVPQCVGGLVTGFVLSFAHTLGEFGVVLMVGGNIEGVTRTVSIDIYDNVQAFNYSAANQTALMLLLFSLYGPCVCVRNQPKTLGRVARGQTRGDCPASEYPVTVDQQKRMSTQDVGKGDATVALTEINAAAGPTLDVDIEKRYRGWNNDSSGFRTPLEPAARFYRLWTFRCRQDDAATVYCRSGNTDPRPYSVRGKNLEPVWRTPLGAAPEALDGLFVSGLRVVSPPHGASQHRVWIRGASPQSASSEGRCDQCPPGTGRTGGSPARRTLRWRAATCCPGPGLGSRTPDSLT